KSPAAPHPYRHFFQKSGAWLEATTKNGYPFTARKNKLRKEMKNTLKLSAAAIMLTAAAGCSTAPGQAVSNLTSGFDYKTGIHVTEAQLASFTKGKTTKNDVINT